MDEIDEVGDPNCPHCLETQAPAEFVLVVRELRLSARSSRASAGTTQVIWSPYVTNVTSVL